MKPTDLVSGEAFYKFFFYDSEVRTIAIEGQLVSIQLSAANVVRLTDNAIGYLSNVELRLRTERPPKVDAACFGRLKEGQCVLNGIRRSNVELPFEAKGTVELSLSFSIGRELQCVGHKIEVAARENSKFTESSNC